MHWFLTALELFRHMDRHLNQFAAAHQLGVYFLLCAIVFCETGFVVTPFLPGDSLLFAVGALAAATGSPISLPLVIVLLCLSANCGDLINYSIGKRVGPKVFSRENSWLLNRKHLLEAQQFYDRHGRMTIVIARFVPIIRTFAPFVAGIGRMNFMRFASFSIGGGILWVVSLTMAGYFFGGFGVVKNHFELVVLGIIAISLLPMVFHYFNSRGEAQKARREAVVSTATAPEPQDTAV